MPDKIQEAFNKVKQDILTLKEEISLVKKQIEEILSVLEEIKKEKEKPQKIRHIQQNNLLRKKKIEELSPNFQFSIGNEGVPTDKQTDKQTLDTSSTYPIQQKVPLLEDLKLLQRKFQELTKQEFLVFSTLYLIGSEKRQVTYRDLALKTRLSESSIRDYISKLIKKGIPLIKEKFNNKQVILRIPSEFRELAPLDLLLRIRAEEY